MQRKPNPFKPTAGALPPLLIGRDDDLAILDEGLDDGPGAPARLALITGARGVGKTVMLSAAAEQAAQRQWLVLAETARPGLPDRIRDMALRAREELTTHPDVGRLTGLTLPGGIGLQREAPPRTGETMRTALESLCTVLEGHGTGVLITIDEAHGGRREEMREIATTAQHLTRDGREHALVLAGLPAATSDLLNDDVLTFLRRAEQIRLGAVQLDDVRAALAATITASGRTIDDDALDVAARATGGYPFLVQLVGYQTWRRARDGHIDRAAAEAGVAAAVTRLGSTVHGAALADLSDVDRSFLLAMAPDDGPSRLADIASRLGRDTNYAGTYRSRLLAAGMIEPAGRGRVAFAVPYLREHLREHASHQHRPMA